jgi:hypothetical protein
VEGKPVKKTEGSAETSYLYDADGELLIRRAKSDGDTVLYLGGTEVRLTVKGTAIPCPARATTAPTSRTSPAARV